MKLELYQNLLLQSLKCWQKRATRNGNWYTANTLSITDKNSHYLHHQQDGVEDNEGHDEVLEGGGHHYPPQFVLEAVPFLGHVPLQRLGIDREIDARFLQKYLYD